MRNYYERREECTAAKGLQGVDYGDVQFTCIGLEGNKANSKGRERKFPPFLI